MVGGLQTFRESLRHSTRVQSLVFALLALFVVQIATLRSHVHVEAAAAAVVELASDASLPPGGKKQPTHNEANCPLWQASGVCGSILVPVAVTVAAPPTVLVQAPSDQRTIAPERFAAAWRSRAPPLL